MRHFSICLLSGLLFLTGSVTAQHDGHHEKKSDTLTHEKHRASMMHGDEHGHHPEGLPMGHAFSQNLPMSRNGSGTGWLPDNSPMYGYMLHSKKWMYMLHGNVFFTYNNQDIGDKGSRGNTLF